MKGIYIELNEKEARELERILNFIRIKVGIKRAFLIGIIHIIERESREENKEKIIELKKRLGIV